MLIRQYLPAQSGSGPPEIPPTCVSRLRSNPLAALSNNAVHRSESTAGVSHEATCDPTVTAMRSSVSARAPIATTMIATHPRMLRTSAPARSGIGTR